MKIRWLALLLCLLMLAPAAVGEEIFELTLIVRAETALLFLNADQAAEEALLNPGEQVTLLSLGANYCLVEAAGKQGYIASDDLALQDNADQPIRVVKANVSPAAQGYLTLRAEASRTGKMLDKLKFGTLLLVLGEDGEFFHAADASQSGYVMAKYTAEPRIAEGEWRWIEGKDAVNFRSLQEYADRSVITRLQPGEMLYVLRDEKGWALAEAGGCQGYIVSKYISDSRE